MLLYLPLHSPYCHLVSTKCIPLILKNALNFKKNESTPPLMIQYFLFGSVSRQIRNTWLGKETKNRHLCLPYSKLSNTFKLDYI